jgi:glycosyltransferase involved in cell wall biosynthesis
MSTLLGISPLAQYDVPVSGAGSAGGAARVDGLRVMLVSTNADLAGAPTHVRTVACALVERGADVLVAFGQSGPVEEALRATGVRCEIVPTMRSDLRFWRDRRTQAELSRWVSEFAPHLVHAHSAKAGRVAREVCRRLDVPCVYTVHGWGFGPGRPRLQSTLVRASERLQVRHTAHYVAVSQADAATGQACLGIPRGRIETIHNGVADTLSRARPEHSRVIVTVSRAHPCKDHDTLFRATAGLDCEVWCIGGGTDGPAFARAIAPYSNDSMRRIRVFGNRGDIPELLAQAGVFALSSRYEGLPLSIIEAMRAGLPVVATDVGGVPELVRHGETGALFPVGDASALRAQLRALLDDGSLRRRWGAAARIAYERGFSLEPMVDALVSVYRRTTVEHASARGGDPFARIVSGIGATEPAPASRAASRSSDVPAI